MSARERDIVVGWRLCEVGSCLKMARDSAFLVAGSVLCFDGQLEPKEIKLGPGYWMVGPEAEGAAIPESRNRRNLVKERYLE